MIAKLKRWETWDRLLVVAYGSLWLIALVLFMVAMARTDLGPSKWVAYFIITLIVMTIAIGASLLGIWRHRRGGFMGLLVLTMVTVAGGQFSPSGNSVSFWLESGLIAGYCILRMVQISTVPKPPPLPNG